MTDLCLGVHSSNRFRGTGEDASRVLAALEVGLKKAADRKLVAPPVLSRLERIVIGWTRVIAADRDLYAIQGRRFVWPCDPLRERSLRVAVGAEQLPHVRIARRLFVTRRAIAVICRCETMGSNMPPTREAAKEKGRR